MSLERKGKLTYRISWANSERFEHLLTEQREYKAEQGTKHLSKCLYLRNREVKVLTCRLTLAAAMALAAKWNASTRYNRMGSLSIKRNVCSQVNKNGRGAYVDVTKPTKKSYMCEHL